MDGPFCVPLRSLAQDALLDISARAVELFDVSPIALDLIDDNVLLFGERRHLLRAAFGLLVDLCALLRIVHLALFTGAIGIQIALVDLAQRSLGCADIGKGILHLVQIEHLRTLRQALAHLILRGRASAQARAGNIDLHNFDVGICAGRQRGNAHCHQQKDRQNYHHYLALHNQPTPCTCLAYNIIKFRHNQDLKHIFA